jgi:hypothetical protein
MYFKVIIRYLKKFKSNSKKSELSSETSWGPFLGFPKKTNKTPEIRNKESYMTMRQIHSGLLHSVLGFKLFVCHIL